MVTVVKYNSKQCCEQNTFNLRLLMCLSQGQTGASESQVETGEHQASGPHMSVPGPGEESETREPDIAPSSTRRM